MPVSNGVEYALGEGYVSVISSDSEFEVSDILSVANRSVLVDFSLKAISTNNFPKVAFLENLFSVYEANWG